MAGQTGIAVAMKFFGKKRVFDEASPNGREQRIAEFKEEWDNVPANDKAEILAGIADGSMTYPDSD